MSVDTTSVGFGLLAPLLHALAWGERPNIDVPFPDTKDFHTLCLGGEGAVQVRTTHRVGVLAHVRSSVVGFTYVGLLYDSGTPGTDDVRRVDLGPRFEPSECEPSFDLCFPECDTLT